MEDVRMYVPDKRGQRHLRIAGAFVVCGAVAMAFLYGYIVRLNTAPAQFPVGVDIEVHDGLSQMQIAEELEEAGVVSSSLLLHVVWTHFFEGEFVLAGMYRFPEPHSLYEVAEALTQGLYKSPSITLTLPEGFSVKDFHALLPEGYTYDTKENLTPFEGYLFPDTYFITHEMRIGDIVSMLRETMEEVLEEYESRILESGFTRDEVLILASILEREANDEASMRIVSGILQNRLEIGMLLQVDATLDYLLDKTSAELTSDDLMLDSPFNTYEYKGLPPSPIANPGRMAIDAVLSPTESEYLYYLTGNDGEFYYAKTFEEHKRNKARYLK